MREIQGYENAIKAEKKNEGKLVGGIKKLQKQNKKEKSFVQMMDVWLEEFEKRLTQSLTEKLFKSDKKVASDKSRRFVTVA